MAKTIKNLDGLADQQGWNTDTCLGLATSFIENVGLAEMFDAYLSDVADAENN